MMKMIVIPIIFFSLIVGTSSLPIRRFGRVGAKVIGWYLFTSFLAAAVGTFIALLINPASGKQLTEWNKVAEILGQSSEEAVSPVSMGQSFSNLLLGMFRNPFEALANSNFLAIIIFSILFGLAIRMAIEKSSDKKDISRLEMLESMCIACQSAVFKIIDWVLEYAPIGVLALTITNFGLYGVKIVGPYVSVTVGVIAGIIIMIFGVYSVLLFIFTRQNPVELFKKMKEPMLMAFVTRSSAATLPVTIKTATENMRIRSELAGFSLPLGATINMDGVCVHLPMFAVLAANMFDIRLTAVSLVILVITTVLASIGAGGVPGGSLMLLFVVLDAIGLNAQQVAVIVSLALAINPILDMFETMNNVTGDMVCSYIVAKREGLLEQQGG
jgi:Na+/H+-dicarboxylate symporter